MPLETFESREDAERQARRRGGVIIPEADDVLTAARSAMKVEERIPQGSARPDRSSPPARPSQPASTQQREVSVIGDFGAQVSGEQVARTFSQLPAGSRVRLLIDSAGGRTDDLKRTVEAMRAAQAQGTRFVASVPRQALSAAFCLAVACDELEVARNARLLSHAT